jgi:hypothetical protein
MTSKRQSLSFVPPLLPNQTIYSWGAVFHEKSGNSTVDDTRLQLFGTTKGRWQFHIPTHLREFCASTQLRLGSPDVLVRDATILPFYTRFRNPQDAERVLELVCGDGLGGFAQNLGISKSATSTHPGRRSCRECVAADLEEYGFSYYHRDQQLPGAKVCLIHETALLELPYGRELIQKERFLWPEHDWERSDSLIVPSLATDTKNILLRVARFAADLTAFELGGAYDAQRLRNTVKSALNNRNLLTTSGAPSLIKIPFELNNFYSPIIGIPELAEATTRSLESLLYLVASSHIHRTHPLELLLMLNWLFSDWNHFNTEYVVAGTEG